MKWPHRHVYERVGEVYYASGAFLWRCHCGRTKTKTWLHSPRYTRGALPRP